MSEESVEPRASPAGARPIWVFAAAAIWAGIVVGINAVLAAGQVQDHFSWGAMAIVGLVSPITNFILWILGILLTPVVHWAGCGASVKPYVLAAALLPPPLCLCQFFVHALR